MSKTTKPEPKKKSPLLTAISWVFDLAILGLLVWFFSSPQNQASFWSTISGWISQSVIVIAEQIHKLNFAATEPAKKEPPKEANPNERNDNPPPPLFVPPPVATSEQLANEVPGDCFPPEPKTTMTKRQTWQNYFTRRRRCQK